MSVSSSVMFNFMQGSDITGESSFDVYKVINPNATREDFLNFIKAESIYDSWKSIEGNADKTEEDFMKWLNQNVDDEKAAREAADTQNLTDAKAYTDEKVAIINNTFVKKGIIEVTLLASGWTGEAAPYAQSVAVENVTTADNFQLVSALADGADEVTQKAYNKAFGIITTGTAVTVDGAINFKAYKIPEIDITVGLRYV